MQKTWSNQKSNLWHYITRGMLCHLIYLGTIIWPTHFHMRRVGKSLHSEWIRLERYERNFLTIKRPHISHFSHWWLELFHLLLKLFFNNYGWRNIITDFSADSAVFPLLENISIIFQFCYMQNGIRNEYI